MAVKAGYIVLIFDQIETSIANPQINSRIEWDREISLTEDFNKVYLYAKVLDTIVDVEPPFITALVNSEISSAMTKWDDKLELDLTEA